MLSLPSLPPYDRWYLTHPPAGDGALLIPALHFQEPAFLTERLRLLGERLGTADGRAVASLWNKHYNAAVISGVLIAWSLGAVPLNGEAMNMSLLLGADQLPQAGYLHDWGPPAGEPGSPRERVFASLFAGHLAPAIQRLGSLSRLAPSVAWGNVGNLIADIYDQMDDAGLLTAAAASDREALLEAPVLPGMPGPNPLRGSVRYEELGLAQPVRVRKSCCLRHRLPGMKPCYTCPLLSPDERIAVARGLGRG